MYRCTIGAALLTTIVCWSLNSSNAQVGIPPSQRNQKRPPDNRQPPGRRPSAGRTAEDILRLLFPPGQDISDDDPSDRPAPRRPSQPRVPLSSEVARLTPYQQRALLRKAVQSLDEDFDRIETGAGWKQHLQIESLGSRLWCGKSVSPDARSRAAIAAIADRFDEVAGNAKYKTITKLWGFQTIRAALHEYAIDPVELGKREVRAESKALLRALGEMKNGASWKKFLQTDQVMRLAASKRELSSGDGDMLRKIAKRFKKIANNPDYRAITRLDGFAATRRSVEELADRILQLKPSAPAANSRRMLLALSASLHALNKTGKEKSQARKKWEQATTGSAEADAARKLLMAIRRSHDEAKQQSKQQMERLKRLIAKTIKENEAKKRARDPHGTVTLLPLDDNNADRKQTLARLVANLRAVNKSGKEKSQARKAWEQAAAGSAEADASRKVLMAIQQNHDAAKKKSKVQMVALSKFIAKTIVQNASSKSAGDPQGTVMLLPLDDEQAAEETVTLLQFEQATDDEPAQYVLLQFEEATEDEPAQFILLQFEEATEDEPAEYVLLQFKEATDNEPAETVLLQFEDVQDKPDEEVLPPGPTVLPPEDDKENNDRERDDEKKKKKK